MSDTGITSEMVEVARSLVDDPETASSEYARGIAEFVADLTGLVGDGGGNRTAIEMLLFGATVEQIEDHEKQWETKHQNSTEKESGGRQYQSKARRTVWVVSFAPANGSVGSGGFWWFHDSVSAQESYDSEVADSKRDNDSHIVRLLQMSVRSSTDDDVTDALNRKLDWIEMAHTAVQQYVPHSADEDRRPTGGSR